jgi:ATP-dependent DNA helicase RecG
MNLQELHELVRLGESERVEFKKTTGQRSEAMRTVCGMLNGKGGFVFFGITPGGKVAGQLLGAQTLEEVHNELRKIEPLPLLDVERVDLPSGHTVLALRVPGGSGPYVYDGRPYLRNGPTTILMPQVIYEHKLLERMHPGRRWENQPAVGFTLADLDHAEITRTIDEAIRRRRMDEPGTRNVQDLLVGLDLMKDGQLLNAAVVLFGKPGKFLMHYPQCLLKMARFRGVTMSEFIDNRQEFGNAFELLLRGQRFLRDHLPVAGRIVPNLFERIDDPLYPPEALREALANALCHRDYAAGGSSVSMALYDDRLEIASIGPLPFGQTPQDLMKPHPSRPWNPTIAGVFYRRGVIEHWGRGTLKMAELTEQAGLPPPEIEASASQVMVRFRPTKYVPPLRVGHDLSELQRHLLAIVARVGPCSLADILRLLPAEAARRTVQANLKMLAELGLVDPPRKRGAGAVWKLKGTPDPAQ